MPTPTPAPMQASPELSVPISHTGWGGPGELEVWMPLRSWGGTGVSERSGSQRSELPHKYFDSGKVSFSVPRSKK